MFLEWVPCQLQCVEALDLQTTYGWDDDFVANTSQNLDQMPICSEDKPIMCLTCLSHLGWQEAVL